LHLAHQAPREVTFTLEVDERGDGRWRALETVTVPAKGYVARVLPADLRAEWLRLRASRDATVTAYLHCATPRPVAGGEDGLFAALAGAGEPADGGLVRPAGHNRNLQLLAGRLKPGERPGEGEYVEIDEGLRFVTPEAGRAAEVRERA